MHADKQKLTRLLKTVRGQIDGLIKMIEDDRYCIDISQSMLKKVNLEILKGHISHCVKESFESNDEKDKQAKIDEVVNVLGKIIK